MLSDGSLTITIPQLVAIGVAVGGCIVGLLRLLIQQRFNNIESRLAALEDSVGSEISKLTTMVEILKKDYHTVDKEVAVLIATKERKS